MNDKVIKKYNEGQDEYEIGDISEIDIRFDKIPMYEVEIRHKGCELFGEIGFYEWLLNPKYKVFEVFDVSETVMEINMEKSIVPFVLKQPEQILKYLAEKP